MHPQSPDDLVHVVTAMARSRGEEISAPRAAEVAADLARIVGHARAAAADNDFSDEPGRFAAVLAGLAAPGAEAA